MKEFDPVSSFNDHPQFKYESRQTLYYTEDRFFLATNDGLFVVQLESINYTNLGSPYRQFARINLKRVDLFDTIIGYFDFDVEWEDAAYIVWYCKHIIGNIKFDISDEVDSNKYYHSALSILESTNR